MIRYQEYREIGIDWICKIPLEWDIKKIKHGGYVKGRIGWKGLKSDEFLQEGYAYLITGTDFRDGKINWDLCYYIDQSRYEEDPYIQLREGDLLITKDGTIGKVALVKNLCGHACLNSGIFLVRPINDTYDTAFLYWILNSTVFTEFINYRKTGSTISHLYQNVFVEFEFPVPTTKERDAIVKFLNNKTQQIDDLIAKKERLIELLKEERTAVINQAVTKGLDPNVPMKDSGIEWLGEIPEHWEIIRLKYIASIQGGSTPKSSNADYWDGNIYWVTTDDLGKMKTVYINDSERKITKEGLNSIGKIISPAGSIIISNRAPIGHLGVLNVEACSNQGCKSIVFTKNVNREYYYYLLLNAKAELDSQGRGTTFKELSTQALKDFIVPAPGYDEQNMIILKLGEELRQIDFSIEKNQREIKLLGEYKTSLINEAVTGKIDVRDYKINHGPT